MAALAKLFGVICMFTGAGGVCVAVLNFLMAASGGTGEEGGLLVLVTAAMVGGSLLLMTIGAIAGVLADIAETRQPAQAVERPYGASTRVT